MATVAVYNTDGKEVEKIDLSDKIFGVEINEGIVHKVPFYEQKPTILPSFNLFSLART